MLNEDIVKGKTFITLRENHRPYCDSVMKAKVKRYDDWEANKLRKPPRTYEQITQSSIERINSLCEPLIEMGTDGFTATYIINHA